MLATDVLFHIPAGGFGGPAGSSPSFDLAAAGNGAAGGAGTAGGAAEGAEEEEAPKEFVPEVKVDESGSAILFKSRAKVYVQGADKARGHSDTGLCCVWCTEVLGYNTLSNSHERVRQRDKSQEPRRGVCAAHVALLR